MWWEWGGYSLCVSFSGLLKTNISPVSLLAVLYPSAAMLLWPCFTPLYGSTLTSPCCPRPCSTSSALQPRLSLACCPVLCLSSQSCPWRRSESRIMWQNLQIYRFITSLVQMYVFCAQVLVVDLGNSRFLRQVGHVLSHVCVFLRLSVVFKHMISSLTNL